MSASAGAKGRIEQGADGSIRVHFRRRLAHPPERVWAALTRPEEVARWFAEMTLDPGAGGRVFLDFGAQGQAEGVISVWSPPHRLEYSWLERGHESRVTWELTPEEGGTVLVLTHVDLPAGSGAEYGAGWHDFLDRLPHHLDGADLSGWKDRYPELVAEYDV
jgi:uncharacterized protein YndB with AHSA1/START domain